MSAVGGTARTLAKAQRRTVLLDSAAALFAQRGFNGVSIEDLGAAAGVSGPAVYRHFSSKQALLAALLVGVSEALLDGGQQVVADAPDDATGLRALVAFHVDFALQQPNVIRVQDRDLDALQPGEHHQVRSLQRAYLELWVQALGRLFPQRPEALCRLQAQAILGLINSTPHSVRGAGTTPTMARAALETMAWAGLTAD